MTVIFVIILIALAIMIPCVIFGCKLCSEDNALGIILLFFGLNLLGVIIGVCILYNNKNKNTQNNHEDIEKATSLN